MQRKKIDFNLTGVPRTLILPLIGRAMNSQQNKSVLNDQKAVELMQSINYDVEDLLQYLDEQNFDAWASHRAIYFDNQIKTYLAKCPHATVVNIGAGLETAFYRVDNGELTWVDLDVPEVIELRQNLLPAPDRVHYIAKSVFDYSWMDDVLALGKDIFLFSAAVFIYFPVERIKPLFIEMSKRLPHAEMVFDTLDTQDLPACNALLKKFNMSEACLQWGFDESDVTSWSAKLKLISRTPYRYEQPNNELPATYMTKVAFSPE